MSVVAPPEPPRPDALEALIREARARQRKRRVLGMALSVAVAGAGLAVFAVHGRGVPNVSEKSDGSNGAATVSHCAPGRLRLGAPLFDGAYTAHVVENLTFTNVSSRSCLLRGWPAIEVVLPGGRLVAAHVGRVRNATSSRVVPARPVLLRPGGAASFHLIEDDGTGLDHICPIPLPSAAALVIPPGSSAPARRSLAMPYCHTPRRLAVYLSPVVAGRLNRYIFR